MKRAALAVVLICLSACATSNQDADIPSTPAPAAPDPRVAELQTSMTELLERLDVMSDRVERLEVRLESQPAPAPVRAAQPVVPAAPQVLSVPQQPVPQQAAPAQSG